MSSPFIQTFTGRKLTFLDPNPDDLRIEDIAHHLAHANRFCGATWGTYTVAEHCVLCSHHIAPDYAFEALLHDAPEAYLCDIPKPVKEWLPDYCRIEAGLDRAIRRRFLLPETCSVAVHDIDERMRNTEAQFWLTPVPDWVDRKKVLRPAPWMGWSNSEAETRFLDRYYELVGA